MIDVTSMTPDTTWRRRAQQPRRQGADLLRITLFLLIFISLGRIHQQYSVLMALRPALLLVALALGYSFLKPSAIRADNLRQHTGKVVIGLAIATALSAVFGISLGGSATYFLDVFSRTLLSCLLLIVGIRHARDLRVLVWAFVAAAGVLVWMAMFVFDMAEMYGSYAQRMNSSIMYDGNDIGLILLMCMPLVLLMFQVSRWQGRVVTGLILIGIGTSLARGGSRGAMVGLVAVGLALLVLLDHVSVMRRLMIIAVVAAGIVVAAPPGYWKQMGTLTSMEQDYNWDSTYGRVEIGKRAIGYIASYPLFGLGIDNFGRAECTIAVRRNIDSSGGFRCYAPHNSYLQVAAELGLVGFGLWITLVGGGIFGVWRLRRRLPTAWRNGSHDQQFAYYAAMYFPAAMIGFAVPALFLSFAYLAPLFMLSAMVAGLHVVVSDLLPDRARTAHRAAPRPCAARTAPITARMGGALLTPVEPQARS